VGVEIKHFNIIISLGSELPVKGIGHYCGLVAVFESQGKAYNFRERHPSGCVRHDAHADFDNPFDYSVIGLVGRYQRTGWVKRNFNPTVGPFFHFIAPLFGQR
jgi:hypothetical protein